LWEAHSHTQIVSNHHSPHAHNTPVVSASPVSATSDGKNDDDDDRASIISLDSDSTNGLLAFVAPMSVDVRHIPFSQG